ICEGGNYKVTNAMSHTGGDHKIFGTILLQHAPHSFDVITGEAPVSLRFKIPKHQFFLQAHFNARNTIRYLASDELMPSTGRLVVKQDTRTGKHIIAFTKVHSAPVSIE